MTDLRPILQAEPEDRALPDLGSLWERGRRRRSRRRAAGIGAAAALLVFAGVAWTAVGDDGETDQTLATGTETPQDSAERLDLADSRFVTMNGSWLLVAAEIDGESVASGLSLEITGRTLFAETICGQTLGGELGGQIETTEEGCDADGPPGLDDLEERFISAITGNSGSGTLDSLIFRADGVELTYERATDVAAEDLFSALDNPSLAAEPSEFSDDPDRDFDKLARLDHPSTDGTFFVGTGDGLICPVISSETATATSCHRPSIARAQRGCGGWCLSPDQR